VAQYAGIGRQSTLHLTKPPDFRLRSSRPLLKNGKPDAMRVHLKGVNRSIVKLASGEVKTYWYAWRGGPRLEGEPGSPEFVRSYSAAHAARIQPRSGTVFTLIGLYPVRLTPA
jgi:hypothetical protein